MGSHGKSVAPKRSKAVTRRREVRVKPQDSDITLQQADADVLRRAMVKPDPSSPADLLTLQRLVGNAAVQHLTQPSTALDQLAHEDQGGGGVVQSGDRHEQQADAVVAGRSAEGLLDPGSGEALQLKPAAAPQVQRQDPAPTGAPNPDAAGGQTGMPVWVEFDSHGKWNPEVVLSNLRAQTSVPADLEASIQDGPKATAEFCVALRDRVKRAAPSDPAQAKRYVRIQRSLTSRIRELWFATPQSPLQYRELQKVAEWSVRFTTLPEPQAPKPQEPEPETPAPEATPADEAKKTKAELYRENLLETAEGYIGKKLMENEEFRQQKKGVTLCIAFVLRVMGQTEVPSDGTRPSFLGPTAYKEIFPKGVPEARSSIGDAWHEGYDKRPITERPNPGDLIILKVHEKDTKTSLGALLYPGGFKHIAIFQGLAPAPAPAPEGNQIWTSIDGGTDDLRRGKSGRIAKKEREFNPKTGLIREKNQAWLRLAGWIDVEKLYEAANPKSK
jgi:hypothetical protein